MSRTLFIDIDGTLLEFHDPFEEVVIGKVSPPPLKGVPEYLMNSHKVGDKIILVTGRPESMRQQTIDNLKKHGIIYDQLVMGVGAGPRYLINDHKPGTLNKAIAINVVTNESFVDIINGML